jgi:hypothetical protein
MGSRTLMAYESNPESSGVEKYSLQGYGSAGF